MREGAWAGWLAAMTIAAIRLGAQVPAWPVAPRPTTVVGITTGDSNVELAGVMGARRLRDGRVLVADSDPPQLRVFSSSGAFLSRVGRKGSGPGEFRGRISLFVGGGDSVLVYDDDVSRWTVYSPTARLVRTIPGTRDDVAGVEPHEYRRALIHPVGRPVAACYRALLNHFPLPRDTAYREVFPDSSDRAWIREEGAQNWTVYTMTGRAIGHVTLPPGFALLQIGNGFVVGSRRNDVGVQRVEVLSVTMPSHGAAPPCAAQRDSFPHDTSRIVHNMRIDLRNLESAGAAFRADYGHYAATFDSLVKASGFTLSRDDQVRWISYLGEGWDAVAHYAHDPRWCRILIGDTSPTWLYRYAFCGP